MTNPNQIRLVCPVCSGSFDLMAFMGGWSVEGHGNVSLTDSCIMTERSVQCPRCEADLTLKACFVWDRDTDNIEVLADDDAEVSA